MFSRDLTLPVLKERPRPAIKGAGEAEQQAATSTHDDGEVNALCSAIAKARDRQELGRLIGGPFYALDPKLFSRMTRDGKSWGPEWVECYVFGKWAIDIWFVGGEIHAILASTNCGVAS